MLLIGSGLHHQVLQPKEPHPLCDWTALLKATAKEAEITLSSYDEYQPTIVWEQMVAAYQAQKSPKISAHIAETNLRKCVKTVLSECTTNHKAAYEKNKVKDLFSHFNGHILNLNFDTLLDEMLGAQVVPSSKDKILPLKNISKTFRANLFHRSYWNSEHGIRYIWQPHGSVRDPEGIRLGLRDYGLLPAAIKSAFHTFKGWERKITKRKSDEPMTTDLHAKVLEALKKLDADNVDPENREPHDHWVTRFMLSDVTIIGAGLSESETGLHWLLCQRARNHAQIDSTLRPQTRMINEATSPSPFFSIDTHDSWEKAWDVALKGADPTNR